METQFAQTVPVALPTESTLSRDKKGYFDDGLDDGARENLLELAEVVERSKPEYAGAYGVVRSEFLASMLAVQEAERARAKSEREINKKQLKKVTPKRAVEFLRSNDKITSDYNREIERVIALDEKCSELAHNDRSIIDAKERVIKILEDDIGLNIICSVMTVGFLNLPQRSDQNVGKGFVIISETKDDFEQGGDFPTRAKNYALHFYEYDLLAAMSTSTTNVDLMSDSYVLGVYKKSVEEFTHKERDDCHRVTSSMFGSMAMEDIISIKHFRRTSSHIRTSFDGELKDNGGFNWCDQIFNACRCIWDCFGRIFSLCKAFYSCFGLCSTDICYYFRETYQREGSEISAKLKTSLDDLVKQQEKDVQRNRKEDVRNPFHNNADTAITGTRTTQTDIFVYLGVELFYVDHISKTKELGVILCSPDIDPQEILRFTNIISREVMKNNHQTLKEYADYTRGSAFGFGAPIDPYSLAGGNLSKSKEFLLGGTSNYLNGSLGLDDAMEEINVEISLPYMVLAVYLNILCGIAAFICAAIAASENAENAVLAVFDFFHTVIRLIGLSLERNTNATFRRDFLLFVVGLVIAISINESLNTTSNRRLLQSDPRPHLFWEWELADFVSYSRNLEEITDNNSAPTLHPTSSPTCTNCTTNSSSMLSSVAMDTETAQEISVSLTIIQAMLSILGAIIAFFDNKSAS